MLHVKDGPVPNYVTLKGNSREVEIGAFLSEEERKQLHRDLLAALTGVQTIRKSDVTPMKADDEN